MPKFIPDLMANSIAENVVEKLEQVCQFFNSSNLTKELKTKIKKDVFQKLTAVELTEEEYTLLQNKDLIARLAHAITGSVDAELLQPGAATGEGLALEYYNSLHYNPVKVTAAIATSLLSSLFAPYRRDVVVSPSFMESVFTEQSVRLKQVASVVHLAFAEEMSIPQLTIFLEQFLHVTPQFIPGLLLREEQGTVMTYLNPTKQYGNTTTWQNFVRKLQENGSSRILQGGSSGADATTAKLVRLVNETIPGHALKPIVEPAEIPKSNQYSNNNGF